MRFRWCAFATMIALALFACARQTTTLPAPPMTPTPTPGLKLTQPAESATPVFPVLTVDQVLNGFKLAGLEAQPDTNKRLDVPGSVLQDTKYVFFLVPSMGTDAGGIILAFSSQDNLTHANQYFRAQGWYTGLYYPWVYTRGNILLLINGILNNTQAEEYAASLNNVR